MVVARWCRSSGWLEGLRLFRGSFKSKGSVAWLAPFPVADSGETTPPGPALQVYTKGADKLKAET